MAFAEIERLRDEVRALQGTNDLLTSECMKVVSNLNVAVDLLSELAPNHPRVQQLLELLTQ